MPLLLTEKQVRERYNIGSRATIYALAARGVLPSVRLGKRLVRFPAEELERWLAAQVTGGTKMQQG
ncbi:MAG: helix-turn-helix domain-containing protein [Chloroflexi bacterium]|nr:helix-turn-helix domain-containing protein [Chloroflexota bacterium]